MSKQNTYIGQKFGRWTVIRPSKCFDNLCWTLVECTCGTHREVKTCNLQTGQSNSCGCLRRELSRKRMTSHGQSQTRLHRIWSLMWQRCNNPKRDNWKYYGQRGITVCDTWKDFLEFFRWSLGNGYQDTLTIDRINNDSAYSPDNCRWVTMTQQGYNKRGYSSSGFKGVYPTKSKKWAAKIRQGNKLLHLGTFDTPEEAAEIYNEAAKRHQGEFAWLNPLEGNHVRTQSSLLHTLKLGGSSTGCRALLRRPEEGEIP